MPIIRIRHPKGVLKLEMPTSEIEILWLYEKVAAELSSTYPEVETFWISLDPLEPEQSRITPAPSSIILSHGQLLYLHLKMEKHDHLKNSLKIPENSIDQILCKMDGKIMRKRDDKLCRHGSIGMCEHCQPLEVILRIEYYALT